MIILDTCILRGFSLHSSSADFLRTIRQVGVERVAVPWMAMEELAAHKALAYQEEYKAAVRALRRLGNATPWQEAVVLEPCDPEQARAYWRAQYGELVEVITSSESALRTAAFREANGLAPSKVVASDSKSVKTGFRDGIIWMSAVEYARDHPDERVYFVSSNTTDFGDGKTFRPPMDKDIEGLGDRFVLLTSMDELVSRLAESAETDDVLVQEILGSPDVLSTIADSISKRLHNERFECTAGFGPLGNQIERAVAAGWFSPQASVHSVGDVRTYRMGEHEWCTATVQWTVSGMGIVDGDDADYLSVSAGFSWTTACLFTPSAKSPRLTILRHSPPRALSAEEFTALDLARYEPISMREILQHFTQDADPTTLERRVEDYHPYRRLTRAYEGSLVRRTRVHPVTDVDITETLR